MRLVGRGSVRVADACGSLLVAVLVAACAPNASTPRPTAVVPTSVVPSPSHAIDTLGVTPEPLPSDIAEGDPAFALDVAHPIALATRSTAVTMPAPPLLPNGKPAVRFTFAVVGCPAGVGGNVTMQAGAVAPVEIATCTGGAVRQDGHGSAVWQWNSYSPVVAGGKTLTVATTAGVSDADPIRLAIVWTSVDAADPTFVSGVGEITVSATSGPEVEYPPDARVSLWKFDPPVLPDGSTPTSWRVDVTRCEDSGSKAVSFMLGVGSGAPREIGECLPNDQGMSAVADALPLPPAGATISVTVVGDNSRLSYAFSNSYWR